MTHGDFGTISSFDEDYAIEIITSFFTDEKCPSLKGKPRLFFIQACRGGLLDGGHQMKSMGRRSVYMLNRTQETDSHDIAAPFEAIKRDLLDDQLHNPPNHQDFLIVRSTMPNHLSFRNPDTGSWFVQDLCKQLEDFGTTRDILELLTHVNWSISQRESIPHKKKQILCISSMLTKILYFNVKTEAPEETELDMP
jgi:Caspase domain